MIHFLDASALVKSYVREPGSREVREMLRSAHASVSRVTYAEAFAAIARAEREKVIPADERDRIFARIPIDFRELTIVELRAATLAPIAEIVVRHALRGFDAVQLASALVLRRGRLASTFWSADGRLCDAAEAEGLRTTRLP